jgi:hypothetical protein
LIDVGIALVYYTDFKKGNLKFRPEFGIGWGAFRAVFGCNTGTINNKSWEALRNQRAQETVQLMVPVNKKITMLDYNK